MAEKKSISNIAEAIVAIMEEVSFVKKEKHRDTVPYKFATESDIIAAVRPIMNKYSVIAYPSQIRDIRTDVFINRRVKQGGEIQETTNHRVNGIVEWTFEHAPTDSRIVVPIASEGIDPGDKATNKFLTYALKYALRQTFLLITGDEDPDATPSKDLSRDSDPGSEKKPERPNWPKEYIDAAKGTGLFDEDVVPNHLQNLFHLSPFQIGDPAAWVAAWITLYHDSRYEDGQKVGTPTQAAAIAKTEWAKSALENLRLEDVPQWAIDHLDSIRDIADDGGI